LPELICECGDVLLSGFTGDHVDGLLGPGLLMLLLWVQVSLIRVLKGLPGAFMSGQVNFFSVMLGATAMGMGSLVAALSSDLL
jgi:hypothetical protein